MMQSASPHAFTGLHVGIIMDGNGRWATRNGRPRPEGHRAGAQAVRRVVEAAPGVGIGTLTLYAFSADNWNRPALEVRALMRLFREYLRAETPRCVRNGVRLEVIGRRDRLAAGLVGRIERAERATGAGRRLLLRIALDYSGRDAILRAAQCLQPATPLGREAFGRLVAIVDHGSPVPELDLLIRTGGERRISNFMLWQLAYTELHITPVYWPDFDREHLFEAILDYQRRDRRFGRVESQ